MHSEATFHTSIIMLDGEGFMTLDFCEYCLMGAHLTLFKKKTGKNLDKGLFFNTREKRLAVSRY